MKKQKQKNTIVENTKTTINHKHLQKHKIQNYKKFTNKKCKKKTKNYKP